jgi:hypothetical protein
MGREHESFLHAAYPAEREKIHLVASFGRGGATDAPDVEDPIGGGLDVYRLCASVIAAELERALPVILARARSRYGAVGLAADRLWFQRAFSGATGREEGVS